MSGLGPLAYLLAALVVGLAAIPSRLGLLGGFLLSLVLTPLGGLLVVLASELARPVRAGAAAAEPTREGRRPERARRARHDQG